MLSMYGNKFECDKKFSTYFIAYCFHYKNYRCIQYVITCLLNVLKYFTCAQRYDHYVVNKYINVN